MNLCAHLHKISSELIAKDAVLLASRCFLQALVMFGEERRNAIPASNEPALSRLPEENIQSLVYFISREPLSAPHCRINGCRNKEYLQRFQKISTVAHHCSRLVLSWSLLRLPSGSFSLRSSETFSSSIFLKRLVQPSSASEPQRPELREALREAVLFQPSKYRVRMPEMPGTSPRT